MTDEAVELKGLETDNSNDGEGYFGCCPVCHVPGICRNIGRNHWLYCEEHKKKWCIGSNLFSHWREEEESTWQENAEFLASFEKVEPFYPEPDPEEERKRIDYMSAADQKLCGITNEYRQSLGLPPIPGLERVNDNGTNGESASSPTPTSADYQLALRYGAMTTNEYRERVLGLRPIPGGDTIVLPPDLERVRVDPKPAR